MKCLRGRHTPERAPPLLSAAAACLCLPAHNVDARRFPLALLCSPRTHLLLRLAPPRALSLPLALAIGHRHGKAGARATPIAAVAAPSPNHP